MADFREGQGLRAGKDGDQIEERIITCLDGTRLMYKVPPSPGVILPYNFEPLARDLDENDEGELQGDSDESDEYGTSSDSDASTAASSDGQAGACAVRTGNPNKKRDDYLEWPEYFMAIAFLSAQRSKDPASQVGACIVNEEKKIVGIGYNGMPNGCSDDELPWQRTADDKLDTKYPYELNAILNKNSADVKRCTIYVALFPCNECAKLVIQSGIREVIYVSDKYHDLPEFVASRRLLNMAGVKCRQFKPPRQKIVIDFSSIDTMPVILKENNNNDDKENTA